ncbi:hypothetical protein FDK21_20220 [Cohaesibacter sp. CAU 1516]|uniref:hypothetical protein n=1 Tax=Cohaesibacter sp. CAU 1516 TaxID=2576038 RepID=UPI0010FD592C|nr:hypothetical protein [Cohaesibacter sp. CAU 1516]TLP42160.1 hypothetical protein FDK21_20220 [Cohaesibacter sp. CAU 1516]
MPANPQKLQHTLTFYNGDKGTDFDRLADIGADAIQAARRALNCLPNDVPIGDLFTDPADFIEFVDAVKERRVLEDGFSDIVSELLAGLLVVQGRHPLSQPLSNFRREVYEALNWSNRFLDLMQAHKARGHGLPYFDLMPTDPTQ